MKIFARVTSFDRQRDGLAWALTIASWECRTIRRRAGRRREALLDDEGAALVADEVDGESLLVARELAAAARDALAELRPRDAATVLAALSDDPAARPDGAVAVWRGGLAGRAARAGLLAGLAPLVAPIAAGAIGHRCAGCGLPATLPLCLAVCLATGAAAGAILGLMAARESQRARFAGAAIAFAATTGALGCVFAGASGLAGMAIGLALGGAAPLLTAAARSR